MARRRGTPMGELTLRLRQTTIDQLESIAVSVRLFNDGHISASEVAAAKIEHLIDCRDEPWLELVPGPGMTREEYGEWLVLVDSFLNEVGARESLG